MCIRLIDAGTVSGLRSQSIYHGLAHARDEDTPDTVVLLTPGDPYVCIGLHQTLGDEVDVEYCRAEGLPVLRREVGGGAVYLDDGQLFVQWIMGANRLPLRVEQKFTLFIRPLVETLTELGIEAVFRPVNDIHVHGRKIAGTGAGRIGSAEVLVGNFILDFDTDRMSRLISAPSVEFRQQARQGLERYMTTIGKELGRWPDPEELRAIYRRRVAKALGARLEPGVMTERETRVVEKMDRKLGSPEFLARGGGMRRPGLKIHEDVYVAESRHQWAGGEIRVTARRRENRLEDVSLEGDFVFHPGRALVRLERALVGVELEPRFLARAMETVFEGSRVEVPGVGPEDWVKAIMGLLESREGEQRV